MEGVRSSICPWVVDVNFIVAGRNPFIQLTGPIRYCARDCPHRVDQHPGVAAVQGPTAPARNQLVGGCPGSGPVNDNPAASASLAQLPRRRQSQTARIRPGPIGVCIPTRVSVVAARYPASPAGSSYWPSPTRSGHGGASANVQVSAAEGDVVGGHGELRAGGAGCGVPGPGDGVRRDVQPETHPLPWVRRRGRCGHSQLFPAGASRFTRSQPPAHPSCRSPWDTADTSPHTARPAPRTDRRHQLKHRRTHKPPPQRVWGRFDDRHRRGHFRTGQVARGAQDSSRRTLVRAIRTTSNSTHHAPTIRLDLQRN